MQNLPPYPSEYAYTYPPELLATEPVSPRESARLLVYSKSIQQTQFSTFAHIADFLPAGAVLVFNETKVLPARFMAQKSTGGLVELLYVGKTAAGARVLANRPLRVGEVVTLVSTAETFQIAERLDKGYLVVPSFPLTELEQFLYSHGTTPIPPYIKQTRLSEAELRTEYQSVLAKHVGSVAAPTASLHFSEPLINQLEQRGFGVEKVTLHVGLGTFAPVGAAQLETGSLHAEHYEIAPDVAERLMAYKQAGRPIIAVGTTVVRTLESAAKGGQLQELQGDTTLFIYPPFQFQFVSGMVTNFHVPESSLLMLVAAFTSKQELFTLYTEAIRQKMRLFSFGDGMLLIP